MYKIIPQLGSGGSENTQNVPECFLVPEKGNVAIKNQNCSGGAMVKSTKRTHGAKVKWLEEKDSEILAYNVKC